MNSLRRITPFLKPYAWELIIGLLLVVLPVAMELVVPWLLQYIIDEGIRTGELSVITRGSLIMLVSAVFGALATLGQGYYRARLSQSIAFDMRNDLFSHIQRLSFANLDQMQTGQLMTRLSSDVNQVRMFLSAGLALLLRALLMIIGSVILLLMTDWQLSVIVLGLLALAGVLIRAIMRTATPLFTIVQEKLSALNTLVQENLAGMQVVKAFVRERFAVEQFGASNLDYTEINIRAGRVLALASPLLTLLTNIGMVAILWLGGREVLMQGRLSVGELVAFNNYLLIGMAPLLLLSNMLTMVSRAEASAERIIEVLDTEPAIRPPATPHTAAAVKGRVVFEHVSFHYQNGESDAMPSPFSVNGHSQANGATSTTSVFSTNGAGHMNSDEPLEVLDHVSFTVEPGQRVALLGATGSGKSTLVNLIPRFYDVTGGRICVDGVDVRQWDVTTLRRRIGMVLQKSTLFSGTVHENIAYGQPDASREAVVAAAQAAQAHDFIMAMPGGYEGRIEERGMNLSGGQKQRIAIARALLIAPAILILDDSTSALEMETEQRLQQALDELMAHCTTFIIAQRINSVLQADQILVLDRGRIVAQGPHAQLLATSPIYQEIYRSQLGENGVGKVG
jgi:ATP-binding cassette subfamily B multidrug efflux pump